nr:MAG TPA: Protein of unknown function (DUF3956) [Caudoviricetes sp.]
MLFLPVSDKIKGDDDGRLVAALIVALGFPQCFGR